MSCCLHTIRFFVSTLDSNLQSSSLPLCISQAVWISPLFEFLVGQLTPIGLYLVGCLIICMGEFWMGWVGVGVLCLTELLLVMFFEFLNSIRVSWLWYRTTVYWGFYTDFHSELTFRQGTFNFSLKFCFLPWFMYWSFRGFVFHPDSSYFYFKVWPFVSTTSFSSFKSFFFHLVVHKSTYRHVSNK